jgi:hypothetical protein
MPSCRWKSVASELLLVPIAAVCAFMVFSQRMGTSIALYEAHNVFRCCDYRENLRRGMCSLYARGCGASFHRICLHFPVYSSRNVLRVPAKHKRSPPPSPWAVDHAHRISPSKCGRSRVSKPFQIVGH